MLGSILLCLFSKSPKSGTANLYANGCKGTFGVIVRDCSNVGEGAACGGHGER